MALVKYEVRDEADIQHIAEQISSMRTDILFSEFLDADGECELVSGGLAARHLLIALAQMEQVEQMLKIAVSHSKIEKAQKNDT